MSIDAGLIDEQMFLDRYVFVTLQVFRVSASIIERLAETGFPWGGLLAIAKRAWPVYVQTMGRQFVRDDFKMIPNALGLEPWVDD